MTAAVHLLAPELPALLAAAGPDAPAAGLRLVGYRLRQGVTTNALLDQWLEPLAPAAAWSQRADGIAARHHLAANGWWGRADPVSLAADLTRVHLLGVEGLRILPGEADDLLADLRPLFTGRGLVIARASGDGTGRWYLHSEQQLEPAFVPPDRALGQPLEDYLRGLGEAGRFWLGLQSEAQMLLHDHAVNRRRREHGLPELNSLWFWGTGRAGKPPATAGFYGALARSPEFSGWCDWLGIKAAWYDGSDPSDTGWPAGAGDPIVEWRADRSRPAADNLRSLAELIETLFATAGCDVRVRLQALPERAAELRRGRLPGRAWPPFQRLQSRRMLAALHWLCGEGD